MNIYLALTLFSIIILVYWVISELFAMLFRFTGLPDEKARFQVISLLTGCGFTTHESELLLTNKSRRRLARITMLFGYVFNITIVSMLINVFLSLKLSEFKNYFSILIPIIAASVIITFMRVPKVRAWGDRIIERLAGRVAHRGNENSLLLIDYIGEDSISQVTLHTVPEAFRDLPLSETGLKTEHNILVMLIEHRGQKAEPATAQTVFLPDDKLTVFGNYQTIAKVFAARERFDESN
jgi:hypothetical protein